jgi:phosphatidate cytidylyltransferase
MPKLGMTQVGHDVDTQSRHHKPVNHPQQASSVMTAPPATASQSRKSTRWGDLRLRVLSAAVIAPLALGCVWIGGLVFAGLVALVAIGLCYEWLGLCGQRGSPAASAVFAAVPLAVLLTQYDSASHAIMALIIATLAGVALTRGISAARPLAFGIPYIGLGAISLVWLRQPVETGCANVIVLLFVVWASDIGAYVAGRAIGGARLAPAISPGKTWSGSVGGLIGAALVGFAAALVLGNGPLIWHPVTLAVMIGGISQAGDLFESLLKRHFGVKDSGTMIPGHGGLLDRLDALLAAAPGAALLALAVGPGVGLWE